MALPIFIEAVSAGADISRQQQWAKMKFCQLVGLTEVPEWLNGVPLVDSRLWYLDVNEVVKAIAVKAVAYRRYGLMGLYNA